MHTNTNSYTNTKILIAILQDLSRRPPALPRGPKAFRRKGHQNSPERHQNLARNLPENRLSPECCKNFMRMLPEFRQNFAGTSTWGTGEKGDKPQLARRPCAGRAAA